MSDEWHGEADGGGVAGDFHSERPVARHPMTWSLPLMQLGGISVRVHALFLLLAAVELLRSALPGMPRTLGLPPTVVLVGCMLVVSVLHEAVRTWAHRRCGGELQEWLLWPLGGLCNAQAEGSRRQRLLAVAFPWFAQASLAVAVGGLLAWHTGQWLDGALPRPWSLDGFRVLAMTGDGFVWEVAWLLQWWNVVSLTLQLAPALPLTGGRVLVAWLEPSRGWSASVRTTARAGIGSAVVLLVLGLASGAWTLSVLALVLWIAARETLDRVQATDHLLENGSSEPLDDRLATDQAELDRILAKIKARGIESLGWRERRRLKAATRRRRDDEETR